MMTGGNVGLEWGRRLVALVVGGSRGIGLACALKCHWNRSLAAHKPPQPPIVIVASRSGVCNSDNIQGLNGADLVNVKCDVRNVEDIDRLVGVVGDLSQGRGPDRFLYAAGITHSSLLLRHSDADIDQVMDVNALGAIKCTKRLLKLMLSPAATRAYSGAFAGPEDVIVGDRSLVFMGSLVGSRGNVGQSVYSASKAALLGFSNSLSQELAPRGIRSNVIEPGFIDTEMLKGISQTSLEAYRKRTALGRIGKVEDVISAMDFLNSNTFITGQVIKVDGGFH